MNHLIITLLIILSSSLRAGVLMREAYQHKLEKKELRVCWNNDSFTYFDTCFFKGKSKVKTKNIAKLEYYQQIIKSIITKEYTLERTGVSFTGWDICPYKSDANDQAEIVVTIKENDIETTNIVSGDSDQGRGCYRYADYFKDRANMVSSIRIFLPNKKGATKLSIEDSIRWVALHEFAHSLGLDHEDKGKKRQLRGKGSIPVSKYDSQSIMSYRFYYHILHQQGLSVLKKPEIALSPYDLHAIKCLYVYDEAYRKKVCHKKFKL